MTPDRLDASPYRERMEFACRKKGYAMVWEKAAAGGFTDLRLSVYEGAELKRHCAIGKRTDHFAEAKVAEDICEWLIEPR